METNDNIYVDNKPGGLLEDIIDDSFDNTDNSSAGSKTKITYSSGGSYSVIEDYLENPEEIIEESKENDKKYNLDEYFSCFNEDKNINNVVTFDDLESSIDYAYYEPLLRNDYEETVPMYLSHMDNIPDNFPDLNSGNDKGKTRKNIERVSIVAFSTMVMIGSFFLEGI